MGTETLIVVPCLSQSTPETASEARVMVLAPPGEKEAQGGDREERHESGKM